MILFLLLVQVAVLRNQVVMATYGKTTSSGKSRKRKKSHHANSQTSVIKKLYINRFTGTALIDAQGVATNTAPDAAPSATTTAIFTYAVRLANVQGANNYFSQWSVFKITKVKWIVEFKRAVAFGATGSGLTAATNETGDALQRIIANNVEALMSNTSDIAVSGIIDDGAIYWARGEDLNYDEFTAGSPSQYCIGGMREHYTA